MAINPKFRLHRQRYAHLLTHLNPSQSATHLQHLLLPHPRQVLVVIDMGTQSAALAVRLGGDINRRGIVVIHGHGINCHKASARGFKGDAYQKYRANSA